MPGNPPFLVQPLSHREQSAPDAGAVAPAAYSSSASSDVEDILEENSTFVMSAELQRALHAPSKNDCATLMEIIVGEAKIHADTRRKLLQIALKQRRNDSGVALSSIDKSKIHSCREAEVHRAMQCAFREALGDAIKWFLDKLASSEQSNT